MNEWQMGGSRAGWKTIPFGKAVRNVTDRAEPTADDSELYVGLEHLDSGSLTVRRWGSERDLEGTKLRMRKGDVLFAKRNAYLKRVAIAPHDGLFSAHGMVLRANADLLLHKFLPFFMQSDYFWDRAISISVGSLSPTINWTTLAEQEFALPPIEEQEKLAEMLQGIEHCLSKAFAVRDIAYSALESLLRSKVPEVAIGLERWPVARFGDHVEIIDPNPSHRYPDYDDNGVPLVATQDFFGRDDYVFDKCKRVHRDVFEKQRARCRFEADDVVFARKGILGGARRYGSEEKAFSHTIVVMKPRSESMDSDFLLWVVRSDSFMRQIQRNMNSNSGVPTLGVKTLEDLQVCLPPKDEQRNIALHAKAIDRAATQWGERLEHYERLKRWALTQFSSGGHSA